MTRTQVLDDRVWARIEPLLPPVTGAMGRPMRDHRLLVEAAVWRYRRESAWRDLPGGVRAVADGVEAARPLRL